MLASRFIRVATLCATLAAFGVSSASAGECKVVRGHYDEVGVAPPQCTSPVFICTAAKLYGPVKGDAFFTATVAAPTPDAATTGVLFVAGYTVVSNASFGDRQGTLVLRNAAAVRIVGDGDLTDTQVVDPVASTGGFAGSTGSLRVQGTFNPVTRIGENTFEGTLCLP